MNEKVENNINNKEVKEKDFNIEQNNKNENTQEMNLLIEKMNEMCINKEEKKEN